MEQFLSKGIGIITTLALAWYLVPEDYALVAMIFVFIALSSALVDGGLGQGLIRKLDVSDLDLNTVFWTNIGLSIIIYITVFFSAPAIASFYDESRLIDLIRVVSLSVFFQSLIVVQRSVLSRSLQFKLQVKVVLPAAVLSSIIAITFAYFEYGVWALIYQILANSFFQFLFFWLLKLWRPSFEFSIHALEELWSFSKFIVLDSFVAIPFKNMYLIIFPKYFATGPVGLYFFAEKVKEVMIGLIISSVQTVTYPALAQIQEESVRLKQGYRKVIAITTFLMFPFMFFLSVLTPVLFELFLPEKWQGASIYLQLMLLGSVMYPLHALNINILQVKGKSKIVLYIGVYKKAVNVMVLIYTINFGMLAVIIGQVVLSVVHYFPNAYYSSKLINYSIKEQIKDFSPSLILSGSVAGLIYYLQLSFSLLSIIESFSLMFLAVSLYLIGAYTLKLHGFELVKELYMNKFKHKTVSL
jgi:O-antigen/teichoic acid export membrane protein